MGSYDVNLIVFLQFKYYTNLEILKKISLHRVDKALRSEGFDGVGGCGY